MSIHLHLSSVSQENRTHTSTIAYDTLVRAGASCRSIFVAAHNAEVTEAHTATCSRGVRIIADAALADLSETQLADILVIPGGAKGAETLSQNADVQGLIRRHLEENKIVGMICAGTSRFSYFEKCHMKDTKKNKNWMF